MIASGAPEPPNRGLPADGRAAPARGRSPARWAHTSYTFGVRHTKDRVT
jgi:hypothetical protein